MEMYKKRSFIAANLLAVSALSSCTIDSYLTDASDVQCDGRRTLSDLKEDGQAVFVVHGENKDDIATITVRREDDQIRVGVSGDITGPPQQLESDGFTHPLPIAEGPELSTFGAGGVWLIDARKGDVVIQGSCNGM